MQQNGEVEITKHLEFRYQNCLKSSEECIECIECGIKIHELHKKMKRVLNIDLRWFIR